jgi:hypothetical protein
MLNGPYMVINQLIKSIWNDAHLEYMLGEKNINPTKNDQDWDFRKLGLNVVIQKLIVIC